ncbi:hypothetical protein RN001_013788 [Aquatica leii]|uniref:Protein singed wings 2 n=1 Tax=Aquatica leii TaxID=1421715 RepID=A0AAN7QDG3_9COLE|nr:hypothetical protein RN001_013788 [Aquatica leii]
MANYYLNNKINVFWALLLTVQICKCCNSVPGCLYYSNSRKYSCSGTLWKDKVDNLNIEEKESIRTLEICNLKKEFLNVHKASIRFPYLTNVTIWQGNVSTITGTFSSSNQIKVLQLRSLGITHLPSKLLSSLPNLEVLDLSGNGLQLLDNKTVQEINRIPKSNISYNQWNCSLNLDWTLKLDEKIIKNVNDFNCYEKPYKGKPLISIAHFKKNVQMNCPSKCDCTLSDVVRDPSNFKLEPIIEVNCSARNFIDFPSVLPEKTKILLLDRNNIQSLTPLISNPIYKDIQDLNLDNNFIDSIEDLEGSYWFLHFRSLSLRNNQLLQLPTYALDNALQLNPNMPAAVRLFLGGNPWKCDCAFIPSFQDLLRKYESQIFDIDEIKCSYVKGDTNSYSLISELSRSAVCRLPSDYSIHTLDLVNGVLASLIVLILAKLAYDYYHFKKTGRLPWIVTKIP